MQIQHKFLNGKKVHIDVDKYKKNPGMISDFLEDVLRNFKVDKLCDTIAKFKSHE